MGKNKQFLSTIFTWLVVIIIPYLVVSCLFGFNFNINKWSYNSGAFYVASTFFLFMAVLAKVMNLFK